MPQINILTKEVRFFDGEILVWRHIEPVFFDDVGRFPAALGKKKTLPILVPGRFDTATPFVVGAVSEFQFIQIVIGSGLQRVLDPSTEGETSIEPLDRAGGTFIIPLDPPLG